jgi:hypothetical protein
MRLRGSIGRRSGDRRETIPDGAPFCLLRPVLPGAGIRIPGSAGGFFGTGIGAGKQKLFYLPEVHTDYIFSVIGEELGFAGVVVVGACFMTLVWVGFRIAKRARDPFGKYIALGVSIVIGVQALVNMMVGLKMLPPKGMVLPFLSYGGSSLILHLAAIGVLTNISMKGAEGIVADPVDRRRGNRRARVPGDSAC